MQRGGGEETDAWTDTHSRSAQRNTEQVTDGQQRDRGRGD